MLKRGIVLGSLLLFSGAVYAAQPIEEKCVRQLIKDIHIEPKFKTLTFHKIQDGFKNYEKDTPGLGYSQRYENGGCAATVYLYGDRNAARLTEEELEKIFRESVFFRVKDSWVEEGVFVATGITNDETEQLMFGRRNDRLLKVRMTCARTPQMNEKAEINTITNFSAIVFETVSLDIQMCFNK